MNRFTNAKFLLLIICFSCSKKENDKIKLEHDEDNIVKILESNYNANFNTLFDENIETDPVRIYQKVEDYLLFINVLGSKEVKGYRNMWEGFVLSDSIPDLKFLYKSYPEVVHLDLPSNITANLFNYQETEKELLNDEEKERLQGVISVLSKMYDDGYAIENKEILEEYFKKVGNRAFEKHLVYRIPIISIALHNFIYKASIQETRN